MTPHVPSSSLISTLMVLPLLIALVALVACGDSPSPTTDGSPPLDCAPITCGLMCEDGLRRGAAGCEICECNTAPDRSCTADEDCVVSIDWTSCCQCRSAYNQATLDGNSCIAEAAAPAPLGCVQDPSCDGAACRCTNVLRAACEAGSCVTRDDCPAGQVQEYGGCATACSAHTDCTVAADYGSCCGGCTAMSRETVDGDPCLAERASESECQPAPGSCDGLGCPSPLNDCTMFESAVCMGDGTCAVGGADGACPGGSMEMDGVCIPVT